MKPEIYPIDNPETPPYQLFAGDKRHIIKTMPDSFVDSIITDPPYGLGKAPDPLKLLKDWIDKGDHTTKNNGGFMNHEWDSFVPQPILWKACLRVLKPGGHLLAFGGTRTYDLLVLGLRIAGFEIRDQIVWVYGNGFPKSLDIWKKVQDMQGWGTGLKPCMEPIVVARKPLIGSVSENVMAFGTGGLNIKACRIKGNFGRERSSEELSSNKTYNLFGNSKSGLKPGPRGESPEGRWPGNFVHDGSEDCLELFPETKAGGTLNKEYEAKQKACYGKMPPRKTFESYGDSGSVARFFYCAKATRKDRNEGLSDPGPQFKHGTTLRQVENTKTTGNNHPTVKPTELMKWLCRLVTPVGGIVLDPFMRSGSTGKAAILEGFRFIGIEREIEYVEIATKRIQAVCDTKTKTGDCQNEHH